jgi:hypothetical protein
LAAAGEAGSVFVGDFMSGNDVASLRSNLDYVN